MNSFEELCKKLSQDIDIKDTRARARTEQEQIRFDIVGVCDRLGCKCVN